MRNTLKAIALCALTYLMGHTATAQDSWSREAMVRYSALHPIQAPITHAMAYKGQLRAHLGLEAMRSKKIAPAPGNYISPSFFTYNEDPYWGQSHASLAAYYTPWEHISFGLSFSANNLDAGVESIHPTVWTLNTEHSLASTSAAYHAKFSEYFAFEGQYSLGFGKGKLAASGLEITGAIWYYIIPIPTGVKRHQIEHSYSMFNQNLSGGISVYTGKRLKHLFQGTFMLNIGHTRYFNFNHDNSTTLWADVAQRLQSNPNVFSLTPSLIFTVNTPNVFSAQFNIGRQLTWLDGTPYSHTFSAGVQLSFRILKKRIFPKPENE